jgi:hypothetical protein
MMEAVNSTLVDAYQTTQHLSPEHNVMAELIVNYALEKKVNNTQIMERLFDRINLNGMVYHHVCCKPNSEICQDLVWCGVSYRSIVGTLSFEKTPPGV